MAASSGGLSPPLLKDLIDDMSSNSENIQKKRVKYYPESAPSPYIVYIRQINIENPIKILNISNHLVKTYSSVKEMKKVHSSKMRIVLEDREQANKLVEDSFFSAYRVYVPYSKVEIDGVIEDPDFTASDIANHGLARFKNITRGTVTILEVNQLLKTKATESGKMALKPTSCFRVTFAGSVLPDYIVVHKVLIPVRLYHWKPMYCEHCKRFGHTTKVCTNLSRCSRCGKSHDGSSTDCPAASSEATCFHCNGQHTAIQQCPKYKQRMKQRKSLQRSSSKKSYASVAAMNPFGLLSVDNEVDDDSDDSCDSDDSAVTTITTTKGKRSRAPTRCNSKQRKTASSPPKDPESTTASEDLTSNTYAMKNPTSLPKHSTPNRRIASKPSSAVTLEELITLLCDGFNVDHQLRNRILLLTPVFEFIWKVLCERMPILKKLVNLIVQ